ncbi:hypothetical protein AcV7_005601 [Taiwanofungus camphoratus]|nr:hypothetical protein AcV7_005601 [Antrodia cinnamomea]
MKMPVFVVGSPILIARGRPLAGARRACLCSPGVRPTGHNVCRVPGREAEPYRTWRKFGDEHMPAPSPDKSENETVAAVSPGLLPCPLRSPEPALCASP